MPDQAAYAKARREVAALKGFYIHMLVFACIISALTIINVLLPKSGWWVQWPLMGWGVALLVHGLLILSPIRLFDKDWEERKVRERLDRK